MRFPHTAVAALFVTAALTALAAPAVAHHSGAGFDQTKVVEITGTIKEFQFKNPHTWIQVDVDDPAKGKVEWSVEWGSPNQLGRQGYRPTTFPPGEKVSIRLNPMHNGSPAGGFVGAKLADGKVIGKWE